MNKKLLLVKGHFKREVKFYKKILLLVCILMLFGVLFYFLISDNDRVVAINSIKNFFSEVKRNDNLDYTSSLINSLGTNIAYILIIWLLGISIVGIPIIVLLVGYKCFIIGFSVSSIISVYGVNGILGSLAYIAPHSILFLGLLVLLGIYSINFSICLFKYLFLKKVINFKTIMHRYVKLLLISLICTVLISFYEVYISTYFIKLFTYLLK